MSKMFIGPHHASALRVDGLWDPETMTTDKEEAAASSAGSLTRPSDGAPQPHDLAPMKPPLPHNILVPRELLGPISKALSEVDKTRSPREGEPVAGAADLLRVLAPQGPWTVRTISSVAGGSPKLPKQLGYHVGPDNVDDTKNGLHAWIAAAEAGKNNCYLHVGVGADGKPKLSKEDIIGSRAVWVDIDPDPTRFEGSRADILKALQAEDPPFSCIVDSGNGLQAYKFIAPYQINGDPANIAEIERRNYAICQNLMECLNGCGAKIDSCHSVDHLMRLPGTTNFLTAKKQAKGYPEGNRVARIVEWHPERVYNLKELPSNPLPNEQTESRGQSNDASELPVTDLTDHRLTKVSARTKRIIEFGHDPEQPKSDDEDSSRSGWLLTMLCGLFIAECSDALARTIITDPHWRIAESVLEKKGNGRDRTIGRAISRARLWIAQKQENAKAMLEARSLELSAGYFVIGSIGGHCRVGEFVEQHGRDRLNLMSFSDFANRETQPFVKCEYASRKRPFGEVWAKSEDRRYYDRVTFAPGGPPVVAGNVLNLWQGFAVEPKSGDWSLMRKHIKEVLANGDPKAAEYIIRWIAWAFQNPDKVAGVALAFRGGQGTGKGVFARTVKNIFGQHGAHTSSLDKVTGRFNAVLQDCCLLFLDEVHLPRGSDALGNFKRMITDPTLQIERKGVDVDSDWPNCLHIIMVGNGEQIAPVESDDRRFAVFDVSEQHKQDPSYFDKLYAEIENGGAAAMLHDLLAMSLGGWRPFPAYRNSAHQRQKALNLSPAEALVERLLQDQRLPGAFPNRPNWCPTHTTDSAGLLDKPFKESCDRRCLDMTDAAFRQTLRAYGGAASLSRDRTHRGWGFDSPAECRARWEKRFGPWSWDQPAVEVWSMPPPVDRPEAIAQAEAEMQRAQERLKAVKGAKDLADDPLPF